MATEERTKEILKGLHEAVVNYDEDKAAEAGCSGYITKPNGYQKV